ncbi:MAG TPA: cytochrome c oxidase assembly protein [Candidatus Limnocylindria bacterium]|nr:cytochrome c oxidase assembly protein [Candidatus Limnocylindria bacterium]
MESVAIFLAVLTGAVYARGVRLAPRRWRWWRTLCFFLGLAAVVLALASGIQVLAGDLFSVHMLQHMLLTTVAAPLLMVGAPVRPLLRGLPVAVRARIVRPLAGAPAIRTLFHVLRHPLVAVLIYVGGLYLWHWPALYDAAVEDEALHVLEHAHFFIGALLFWSVVIDPEPFKGTLPYAARIVYLLLAGAAQNTILGGLLSFSTRVLYAHYERAAPLRGIDALTDQRVGGAIMWVPGDTIFLIAASVAFFMWLEQEEREQRRREQGNLRA